MRLQRHVVYHIAFMGLLIALRGSLITRARQPSSAAISFPSKSLSRQPGLALVDAILPLQGERGRPRRRPDCVVGDRGYDTEAIRSGCELAAFCRCCDAPHQARQRFGNLTLGRRADIAWLNQFRGLRVRYDKRADIHEAFLSLGCALICWPSLRRTWRTA